MMRRIVVAALACGLALVATEVLLRAIGLGQPILYDNRVTYGYRPVADQTRARLGGTRLHVNALGCRGPELAAVPPADTTRVLFLGDSVTWGGSYIDDAALFAARAAAYVPAHGGPPVEALNAGVNGWGPENMLGLVLEHEGFASRVWVVIALEDDFRREKTHAGEVPYFQVEPWTAWEELGVIAAHRILTHYKRSKPPADLERLSATNLTIYRAILQQATLHGADALVVWHAAEGTRYDTIEPHRERLATIAHTAGAAWLDLTETYRQAGNDLYVDGLHLSAHGHAVAGEAIGAALVRVVSPDRSG